MSVRPTPGLSVTPGLDENRERRSNAPTQEPPAKRRRRARHNELDDEDVKPVLPTPLVEVQQEDEVEVVNIDDSPEVPTIDLRDEAIEWYYLEQFNKWHFKHEVAGKLREGYAKIFDGQTAQARPGSELKQHMDEIAAKVRCAEIAYILERDKSRWLKVLHRARTALQKEHQEVADFCESLKRLTSRNSLQNGLMIETQARCVKIDKALEFREKIVKEMQKWSGQ